MKVKCELGVNFSHLALCKPYSILISEEGTNTSAEISKASSGGSVKADCV